MWAEEFLSELSSNVHDCGHIFSILRILICFQDDYVNFQPVVLTGV